VPAHLFTIERSKNANLVVYDARLTDSGELDPKSAVVVYWLLKAQDGRREELNRVEASGPTDSTSNLEKTPAPMF
jgi:hypothetical protein